MALITTNTSAPGSFRAGDTVRWSLSLQDYSAATHSARYIFSYRGLSDGSPSIGKIVIPVEAGDDYNFTLSAAETVSFYPGRWTWDLVVVETATGDTRAIRSGTMIVDPKPGHVDEPSFNSRMVTLLEGYIAGKALLGHESTTIRGQSISYLTISEATALLNQYRSKLQIENMRSRTARGLSSGMTGQVRFIRS